MKFPLAMNLLLVIFASYVALLNVYSELICQNHRIKRNDAILLVLPQINIPNTVLKVFSILFSSHFFCSTFGVLVGHQIQRIHYRRWEQYINSLSRSRFDNVGERRMQ